MKYPRRWGMAGGKFDFGILYLEKTCADGPLIEVRESGRRVADASYSQEVVDGLVAADVWVETFDHHAEPAAGEKGGSLVPLMMWPEDRKDAELAELRTAHTNLTTSFNAQLDELKAHRIEIAELKAALSASFEREKFERAGRAEAERLAAARLRTIHGATSNNERIRAGLTKAIERFNSDEPMGFQDGMEMLVRLSGGSTTKIDGMKNSRRLSVADAIREGIEKESEASR